MTVIDSEKARKNLDQLIEDVSTNRSVITISNSSGKKAVLLSVDDWNTIQETEYLISVQGLDESNVETGKTLLEESIPEDDEEW